MVCSINEECPAAGSLHLTEAMGGSQRIAGADGIRLSRFQMWKNSRMPYEQRLVPDKNVPDFMYGTAWKEDRTEALTELAIRSGFRAIDTANQRKHYFEAGVGEGLAAAYRDGVVSRADLFLQTKFTYRRGQDHRLPYDPEASLSVQVAQSMASSLEHLGADYVDSYLLHGPSSVSDWADDDSEVWEAMCKERDRGHTRFLGVSNISLRQLEQMTASHAEAPAFVQNRCYARNGWDRDVRSFLQTARDCLSGLLAAHREQEGGESSFDCGDCRARECNSGTSCV
jgi:diketogulonate reductase-like aldo/keto reductase